MKKINADQVEVVNADGTHVAGKVAEKNFSGFKIVKMGPAGGLAALLLLPILIPVAIIGFFLLLLMTMLFGKTVFKSGMARVIRW